MFRSLVLVACSWLLAAQAREPALLEVQSLLDAGKLKGAESAGRAFIANHAASADGHYLLAYILFREGDPKASLAEYKEAARYREPSALDLEAIGCDYFSLEDYVAADQWLTKAVTLNPRDALAHFYLGRTKFNAKRFEEAIREFLESLKLEPKNVKAANNLGLAYEALGKTEEAIAVYRNAISLDPAAARDAGVYLNFGTLLVENERAPDSLPYLREVVAMTPTDSRARIALGKAYLQLNRFDESRKELEKATQLTPEAAPLHFLLSQAYRKLGLVESAREEMERYTALTGAHSSPTTPLEETRSLLELGKLSDAERVIRSYLESHKNSADGHFLLGYVLFKKQDPKASLAEYTEGAKYRNPSAADLEAVAGDYVLLKDYPDADKWFTKAVELNSKDALGWYYLGRTKYNENRFDEAVRAFQKCLELDPKNVKAQDNLGLSYEGLNRVDDAIAAYRTAIAWQAESHDADSGPNLDLGSLLVDNDRAAEALPYLLRAAEMGSNDERVHRQLGKAYSHLNELQKARTELERAVELAPENPGTHFMLAQVYRRQGLLDKAKIEADQYSKLAQSNQSQDK